MALGMVQTAARLTATATRSACRRRFSAGERPNGVVTLVTIAVALVGCSITAQCPVPGEQRVDLPNGEYTPAVAHRSARTTGAPFFATEFPRGTADSTLAVSTIITDDAPAYDASDYPTPGEAIPSAVLRVDRGAGIVLRSYRTADGRLVEEHWRIAEAP